MTGGLARWTAHCPRRAGAPARLCICAPLRTDGRPMAMCFSIASPPGCIGLLGCGHARQAPSQRQRQRHPWATEGMNARDKGQSKASSPVGSAGNPSLHPAISHMPHATCHKPYALQAALPCPLAGPVRPAAHLVLRLRRLQQRVVARPGRSKARRPRPHRLDSRRPSATKAGGSRSEKSERG